MYVTSVATFCAVRLSASAARAFFATSDFGKSLIDASKQPMTVHRRMPVVAAIERGRQLPRQLEIGIARHEVRDLVRVLLVHAVQRKLRETRGRGFVQAFGARDAGNSEGGDQGDEQVGACRSSVVGGEVVHDALGICLR